MNEWRRSNPLEEPLDDTLTWSDLSRAGFLCFAGTSKTLKSVQLSAKRALGDPQHLKKTNASSSSFSKKTFKNVIFMMSHFEEFQ